MEDLYMIEEDINNTHRSATPCVGKMVETECDLEFFRGVLNKL